MSVISPLLAGRLALITGGGSGIGRAVSLVFAREGAKVIVADVSKEAAESTVNGIPDCDKHHARFVDVTSSSSVNMLFSELRQEFGTPDTLVNCAGIVRDCFMTEMTEEMFDDVISVNLKGTYLMTQAASKLMIEEKISNGSLINISSVSGKIGNMGQCNYSASKAGVASFTKTVARELGKYGIRCNAVMPGYIATPMTASVPEKIKDKVVKEIPLGRMGKPEEIAEVCAFLASSKSSYMTGSIVQVSGGLYM